MYGIARKQRECHGHGDFSDELAIRRQYTGIPGQPYAEEFPPLFLTEKEALDWIKAQRYIFELEPVKLKLMLTAEVYQSMYNLLVRLEGIEPTCSQARPLPFG